MTQSELFVVLLDVDDFLDDFLLDYWGGVVNYRGCFLWLKGFERLWGFLF